MAVALVASACAKKKECRCSVPHDDMTHIVTVKGDCTDVNVIEYWDAHNELRVDTLLCVESEE